MVLLSYHLTRGFVVLPRKHTKHGVNDVRYTL